MIYAFNFLLVLQPRGQVFLWDKSFNFAWILYFRHALGKSIFSLALFYITSVSSCLILLCIKTWHASLMKNDKYFEKRWILFPFCIFWAGFSLFSRMICFPLRAVLAEAEMQRMRSIESNEIFSHWLWSKTLEWALSTSKCSKPSLVRNKERCRTF